MKGFGRLSQCAEAANTIAAKTIRKVENNIAMPVFATVTIRNLWLRLCNDERWDAEDLMSCPLDSFKC